MNELENKNLPKWRMWCRLCAKEDPEANIDVFIKEEPIHTVITSAIEKYFWVQISQSDCLSGHFLCPDCLFLLKSLTIFSERVNKVQEMFSLLQSSNKTLDFVELEQIRSQYGLLDENREHIICHPLTEIHYFEAKPKFLQLNNDDQEENNPIEGIQQNSVDDCDDVEYIDELKTFAPSDIKEEFQEDEINNSHDKKWDNEEQMNDVAACESDIDEQLKQNFSNSNDKEYSDKNGEIENSSNISMQRRRKSKRSKQNFYNSESKYSRVKRIKVKNVNNEDDHLNGYDDNEDCDNIDSNKSRRRIKDNETEHNCSECPKKFKLIQHYQQHMRISHDIKMGEPQFPCDVCSKIFYTEKQCNLHQKKHSPSEKKMLFTCPDCNKKFTKHKVLENHITYVHMNQKHFICEECGRLLKTFAALKEHKLTHTDDRPFECEVCQKKFKNKARLKIHADIHTNTNYICTQCGLILNTRRTLKMHMLVHSDQKRFKCDYCGTEFKRAKALKNHLILHTGLKPYTCNFCHKTFANGSNCRSHKKKAHPDELAAMEAAGAKQVQTNIPKLEQLRAVTKASENLNPVVSKHSGCFSSATATQKQKESSRNAEENLCQNKKNEINNGFEKNAVRTSEPWKKLNQTTINCSIGGENSHSSFDGASPTKCNLDVINSMPTQTAIIPIQLQMPFQQHAEQFSHGIFDTLSIGS